MRARGLSWYAAHTPQKRYYAALAQTGSGYTHTHTHNVHTRILAHTQPHALMPSYHNYTRTASYRPLIHTITHTHTLSPAHTHTHTHTHSLHFRFAQGRDNLATLLLTDDAMEVLDMENMVKVRW